MAGFKAKQKTKQSSGGSNIDYDFINSQLPIGESVDARVSLVIDLGEHDQGKAINKKGITYFASEDEAWDFVDAAEEMAGEQFMSENNLANVEEVGSDVYVLPFKIVKDKWVFSGEESEDNIMYAFSEDEADKLVEQARKLDKYKNISNFDYEVIEDALSVPFNMFDGGSEFEIGIMADLTDTYVEYVEGEEPRQYRVDLCNTKKVGEEWVLHGYPVRFKKDTGTFDPKTTVAKLIKATGNDQILEDGEDQNMLDQLLNGPYFQKIDATKNGKPKFPKDFGKPRAKDVDSIAPLEIEGYPDGVCITFDDDVEDIVAGLKAIFLRGNYIKRIKSALNYKGSNMEKAIEIFESERSSSESDSDSESRETTSEVDKEETSSKPAGKRKRPQKEAQEASEPSEPEEQEEEAEEEVKKPTRRTRKVEDDVEDESPKPKKRGRPAKKVEPEPEEGDDGSDEDVPW